MFGEIASMVGRVVAEQGDNGAMGEAAGDHVGAMDASEVQQHVETAAANAAQNGAPDVAQLLTGLLSRSANGESLKQGFVELVSSNPQILQHFVPEFAQGLLSRI